MIDGNSHSKAFCSRALISMLIVSWANNRASLILKPPSTSLGLSQRTHTLFALCPRGQVSFLPSLMRGRRSSPLLLMFSLFCHRLFGSKPVGSEPHMAPMLRYMATERTERVFHSYTILQERSKRICAHLTSPLDGEITERWAAVKSCDWRLSG